MEEKKGNIVLFVILAVLIIIAIVIVIVNPNKVEKTVEISQKIEEDSNNNQEEINLSKINEQEEKELSMQTGGTFCKIANKIVFYEDNNKTIYLYNIESNEINKVATLSNSMNKMYFDGENIYYIPSYYSAKGIYKIDLQGNITNIYDGASLQLWITENEVYFVNQIGYDDFNNNPQGTICVMDKDGNNVVELAKSIKNYFYLQNDKIYYTTQDRKMYAINKDRSEQKDLVQGRKFAIDVADKYLLYIDYANQEAEHVLNLETYEDSVIGHFGILKNYQGKTYLNARKRLDDGSIETEYTLFEIEENGIVKEIGKVADFSTELKYISNGKAYLSNQQEGTYTINLEDGQKESAETYRSCRYFLGGYGYKIEDSNLEDIKIERIELQ